ncbi:hypothetical protein GCM10008905_11920 [Clostridium malenominatum]|uniref:Uncharacterized protein n=1 Tax=Clostridium malenominatum TaxID=1539 RepID=A0ABN1IU71_9CLOT
MNKHEMKNIKSLKEFQNVTKENTFNFNEKEISNNNIEVNSFQNFKNCKCGKHDNFNGIH